MSASCCIRLLSPGLPLENSLPQIGISLGPVRRDHVGAVDVVLNPVFRKFSCVSFSDLGQIGRLLFQGCDHGAIALSIWPVAGSTMSAVFERSCRHFSRWYHLELEVF